MADREDNVYQAKLAEQAERYDGMPSADLQFAYFSDTSLLPLAATASMATLR